MSKEHAATRVVIALGGNALGNNPKEQMENIRKAAPAILGVIDDDTEIIITPLIINFIRTPPTFIRTCADECGNPIP